MNDASKQAWIKSRADRPIVESNGLLNEADRPLAVAYAEDLYEGLYGEGTNVPAGLVRIERTIEQNH